MRSRRTAAMLAAGVVLVALAGCTGDPAARCDGTPGIHVALAAPTDDPALFWVVELVQDGREVDEEPGTEAGCVRFSAPAGEYVVRSAYWVQGTDCWYQAQQPVTHDERSAVALTDFTYQCE